MIVNQGGAAFRCGTYARSHDVHYIQSRLSEESETDLPVAEISSRSGRTALYWWKSTVASDCGITIPAVWRSSSLSMMQAEWRNHRVKPLVWQVDKKAYSPSALVA